MGKIFFLILFLIAIVFDVNAYRLKQVVVLGRHNIRTPLTADLESFTPNKWPSWTEETGFLTSKGAILEGYLGKYFAEWLQKEKLLTKGCPAEDFVYIYANAPQRTVKTAKMFAKAAFKNCNVTVNYKENIRMDPVFNPIIHNTTEAFKSIVINDMQEKIDEFNLTDAYLELNKILNLKNSKICIDNGTCDLTEGKDNIFYEVGKETDVIGPISIGNSIVDSFLMEYYNGHLKENVGWGAINENKLELLTEITKAHQNVRFNMTTLAKDAAKPLLQHMFNIFVNENPKFTLLVGHDSNLNSVMAALEFKPYELPNQYEKTPVGGKIVFQKYYDKDLNRHLLKINYVYQSMQQLRNGTKLSVESPPNEIVMEINSCSVDSNGYCLWDDFIDVIKQFQ